MFGLRKTTTVAALPAILVPQSAFDDEASYALPDAVAAFVNHAIHTACYHREELPQQAMQAFHVDYYVAQVNNGGHGQYVRNSGWHQYQIDDIRAGLRAIGSDEAIALYEDLCALADRYPDAFRGKASESDLVACDAFVAEADRRFFEGLGDRLTKANSDWIRSLDCLLVLEDAQYRETMAGLPARNPEHAKRKAEAEAQAAAARDRDPITQACRCIGALSPPAPVRVEHWSAMFGADGPDGERGYALQVSIEGGRGARLHLFPTFGVLTLPGQEERSKRIPIEVIRAHVKRETGRELPQDLWR